MGGFRPALASLGIACTLASATLPAAGATTPAVSTPCEQMPAAFYDALDAYAEGIGIRTEGAPQDVELSETLPYYGRYASPLEIDGVENPQNPDITPPERQADYRVGSVTISCRIPRNAIAEVYIHEALGHGVLNQGGESEILFPTVLYTLHLQETPEPAAIRSEKEWAANEWYLAVPDDPAFPVLALNEDSSPVKFSVYSAGDWKKIAEMDAAYFPYYYLDKYSGRNRPLFFEGMAGMEGRLGKFLLPIGFEDGTRMSFQPSNEVVYLNSEVIARILQTITSGNVSIAWQRKSPDDILLDRSMGSLEASPAGNYTDEMGELGREAAEVYKIVGDQVMLDLIYGLEGRGGLTFEEGMAQLASDPQAAEGLAFARYAFGELPYRLLMAELLANGAERMEGDFGLMMGAYDLLGKVFPEKSQKELMDRYFEEGFHLSAGQAASLEGSYPGFSEAALDGSKLAEIERFKEEDFGKFLAVVSPGPEDAVCALLPGSYK